MPEATPDSETWKKMVLSGMPTPAWLEGDAPASEIVISSRQRYARNLREFPFPHHASEHQLTTILQLVQDAVDDAELDLASYENLTHAERDFMLGSRLVSPEFRCNEPGRALLLDRGKTVSIMVNEEDHLRIQALTPGWSIVTAQAAGDRMLSQLASRLQFMHSDQLGYLTASPSNLGHARRRSALFHLIGLAHTKRLMNVLKALSAWGLTARGLFGESSRAVGAFFQVSTTEQRMPEFVGAGEYLIEEEQKARMEVRQSELTDKAEQARDFAIGSTEISLADAMRVFAWVRWASSTGLPDFAFSHREVDRWISTLDVQGTQDQRIASRHRAVFVRERLEQR